MIRQVEFISDGIVLRGYLHSPDFMECDKIYPIAIFTDGKSIAKNRYVVEVARRGYLTLSFDFRGHGVSDGYQSSESQMEDIRNAISFVLTLPEVDANNVYISTESALCNANEYLTIGEKLSQNELCQCFKKEENSGSQWF